MAADVVSDVPRALRLLSLDGGGIRGISELIILQEIMHRVQRAQKLPSPPLPADYFDLICGTSTGGLIAILLGRLRLSVPEAIDKYRQLAKEVFSEKKGAGKDGTFKATKLENAIKKVVKEKLNTGEATMWSTEPCKTFVCAVPAKSVDRKPRLFRTWSADKNPGYNCTIWEAGRATSAAPTFFKRIFIGDHGLQEEFIDAGIGCNNPVECLIQEAVQEFGSQNREVSCIVSIGTGMPKVAGFKAPNPFQRFLPLDLIRVLKQLATDSEDKASELSQRGLEDISLEEWEKLGDVRTHTETYLKTVDESIDLIVNALLGKQLRTFPVCQLDGNVQPCTKSAQYFIYPSYKVGYFVERKDHMQRIKQCFEVGPDTTMPKLFVLLGMGGCGKSQLALDYCHKAQTRKTYSGTFWIDAASPRSAQQSIATIAEAMSKPAFDIADDEGNLQFVRDTIETYQGRWLLIFDNFDDPGSFRDKNIKDFFPRRGQGSIIVTTRRAAAKALAKPDDYLEMSAMFNHEALELLFQRAQVTDTEANIQEGKKIVQRLGHHALAIDQAGAYILARNLGINLYLKHFNDRRDKVLRETPDLWDYTRKLKDSPEAITKLTVLTTWELSFDLITGDKSARDDKEHVLNLMAFFNTKAMSDEFFQLYGSQNIEWMTTCVSNKAWDVYQFQDILRELFDLSLLQNLQIDSSGTFFTQHPLIQDCVKLRLGPESQRRYTIEAFMILSTFLRIRDTHKMRFETKQATLTQLRTVWQSKKDYLNRDNDVTDTNLLTAFDRFAYFSLSQGKYDEAEPMYRETLELREKALGKQHPDTLGSMNDLADLLESQGK